MELCYNNYDKGYPNLRFAYGCNYCTGVKQGILLALMV